MVEVIATLASGIIVSGILLGYKITLVYMGLIALLTAICWLYTALCKYITKKQRQVLEDLNMVSALFFISRDPSTKIIVDGYRIDTKYSHRI